jgi:2'-5' RNA ligase
MRSIELTFDDATDSIIRSDWTRISEAGVRSLASHSSPSNSPHITLAAGHELAAASDLLRTWEALPVRVTFSGAVVFPGGGPGKYTLARSVVMTQDLLELHHVLHSQVQGTTSFTMANAWTPHVTLARRVPEQQIGEAIACLDLRLEGWGTAARLWDNTTRTLALLSGPGSLA